MSLTKKYSVSAIAKAFGVDRNTLTRRMAESGIHRDPKGISIREAFQAWTKRERNEDARRRKNEAEAALAELTLAERRGEIVERVELALKDVAVRVRQLYLSIDYVPSKFPQRFAKEVSDIRFLDGFFEILTGKKRKEPK